MIKIKTNILLTLVFVSIVILLYKSIIMQSSEQTESTQITYSINENPRREDNNASTNRELTIVKSQITRLENQQHKLSKQLQELITVVHTQASFTSEVKPDELGTLESTESWQNPLEALKTTDPVSAYNIAFNEESDDLDWKLEVETTIIATFEELNLTDTLLNQVECRETACRLEFFHPDGNEGESFIETILPSEPFTTEFYSKSGVKTDGTYTTLVFIARPTNRLF